MTNLNSREELLKLDKSGVLLSIEQLPGQLNISWQETKQLTLPFDYRQIDNVIVCGMGASWLGAHIMQGICADSLNVPLLVVHDYHLPHFVTQNSLVIASSYSGKTEETVSCLIEAHKRHAHVVTISSGGALAQFAKENDLVSYVFDGKYNPAHSPRLGLGYSIGAQLSLLSQLGLLTVTDQEIGSVVHLLKQRLTQLRPEAANNEAMTLAKNSNGFIPVVTAGSFLLGNAHAFSNQFNETAKTFGTYMHIPELNHHLMEGLTHPEEVKKLKFVFLESDLYDKKIQIRFTVTQEVLGQNHISHLSYKPHGNTKLAQSFDTLLFGSFATYYLAMLYGIDPAPNPWVDFFKKRLKQL